MSTLLDDEVRDLAARFGVTDADVAARADVMAGTVDTYRDASAYLTGVALVVIASLADAHGDCRAEHCGPCGSIRSWVAAVLGADRIVDRRRRPAPVEDREHYDRDDPVSGAPLPAGVVGEALGHRTGEHPLVPVPPEDGHRYACCGKVGRISRHEPWCPEQWAAAAATTSEARS